MNALRTFNHEMFGQVRTMTNERGETFFVGKDVAEALGYSDASKAIRVHVDSEDKGVDEMATPGGMQKVIIINESGLYSLVLSSKLEHRKVMYKQSGQWMLYADYARKGYAKSRTTTRRDIEGDLHTYTRLVWTEEGRRFIHRLCHDEEVMITFLFRN